MEKQILEQIKAGLEKRRDDIRKELSRFATKDPNLEGDWDSTYPRIPEGNLEEAAGEVEEYSTRIELEFNLESQLKKIEEALARIAQGTYGTCETCKKEIDGQRLLISPEATRCGTCMTKEV